MPPLSQLWLGGKHGSVIGNYALVSPCDYERLSAYKWTAVIGRAGTGVRAVRYEAVGPYKQRTIQLHRDIMEPPQGVLVDHINGDPLDNRRENLRLATYHENNLNRHRLNKNNQSGHHCIGHIIRGDGRMFWRARIRRNGKTNYLGTYATKAEAIAARDAFLKKENNRFVCLPSPS